MKIIIMTKYNILATHMNIYCDQERYLTKSCIIVYIAFHIHLSSDAVTLMIDITIQIQCIINEWNNT